MSVLEMCASADCNEEGQFSYSGCLDVAYCGAKCQGADWQQHKIACRTAQTARKAQAACEVRQSEPATNAARKPESPVVPTRPLCSLALNCVPSSKEVINPCGHTMFMSCMGESTNFAPCGDPACEDLHLTCPSTGCSSEFSVPLRSLGRLAMTKIMGIRRGQRRRSATPSSLLARVRARVGTRRRLRGGASDSRRESSAPPSSASCSAGVVVRAAGLQDSTAASSTGPAAAVRRLDRRARPKEGRDTIMKTASVSLCLGPRARTSPGLLQSTGDGCNRMRLYRVRGRKETFEINWRWPRSWNIGLCCNCDYASNCTRFMARAITCPRKAKARGCVGLRGKAGPKLSLAWRRPKPCAK